ncbi:HCP-like protein [Athelia psychrophila]|uniref:HCP-like protein n=1 Tax=Athelia psychrophila TaxID=1759441 RepID=A0A166TTK7_9AGAM|nr:HCP-like protein [Fibularhizoctonia sp. CBS 109695]
MSLVWAEVFTTRSDIGPAREGPSAEVVAYPGQVAQNPRTAFRDLEAAARGGYAPAWFKLGRDYENFSDFAHAKDCFERWAKARVESCVYRLGMASLSGQLGIQPSPAAALPHLARAAALATTRVPQPAYVYALLLLNEFTQVSIDPREFAGYIPPRGSAGAEARKHLERAAFLNFAPAQYKLGHCYDFAQPPPFPFDPLLSVQYYFLASQQGEDEADMALSKWFLCGSEGAFPKDEDLAYTFAEKAAVRGLGSAEFAMGYYAEVGVGPVKDVEAARAWYTKAAEHGNTDANDRLVALGAPGNAPLSRQQHDDITETKLVRKRTQARERSSGERDRPPSDRQGVDGRRIVENVRRGSMDQRPGPGPPAGAPMTPIAESPRMRPQQPPQQQGGYPQQPPAGQQRPPQQAYSPPPGQQRPPQQQYSPPPGQQRPPPQAGQQRAFPGQNRYSLVDSPVPSPPPGQRQSPAPSQAHAPRGRGGPGGQGRGRGGPQGPHANSMPPPPQQGGYPAQPPLQHMQSSSTPRKQGATTFAEMGITAAKAEDKECVIM